MSIYSLTPLGAPPSDTVDHSVLDSEASDDMVQTRPDTQPSDLQMDDSAPNRPENGVEQMDVGKVTPLGAERVSCTTNVFSCLSVYIEDAVR